MTEVSVIIPCFNAERWIRQALQSVATQGLDNVETIVIDDGSTDESAKIIEKEFPCVNLVKTKHQGASRARNVGTELAKGEFIQYLDADDMLAPDKLKIQIGALSKSGADVAYGDWKEMIYQSDGSFKSGRVRDAEITGPLDIAFFTDAWNPIHSYLFRHSIVERVGGWNEGLPIIQDARFVLDCALQGAKFVYCKGTMAYYTVHYKESLSTKDHVGFIRDCLLNALEVQEWWLKHGGINRDRRRALLRVYGYVAREELKEDKPTFESAYKAINNLIPFYVPEKLRVLNLLSQLFGYEKAGTIAASYRRIRDIFRRSIKFF